MKRKVIAKRMATAMLTGVMAMSMGMNAFAAEVEITKDLTKKENVYAPMTNFTFTIEAGTPIPGNANQDAILAGPMDAISFVSGNFTEDAIKTATILSAPKDGDIGKTSITVGTTKIYLDDSKFGNGTDKKYKYGIYRYNLQETEGTYEGLYYTPEVKFLDVYVSTEGIKFIVTGPDADKVTGKDDGIFINAYEDKDDPDKPVTGPKDLVITKTVSGNQGIVDDDYSFTVQVDGAEGEWYYVFIENTDGSDRDVNKISATHLVSGTSQTFTLKGSQKATIYGLSQTDKYTVEEADYSTAGYTTTVDGTAGRKVEATLKTADGKIVDTTVNFVNDKDVTTPTGIILTFAPYVLMIAAAGIFAVMFLRKKREEF